MEKKKLVIDYVEYGSLAELPDDARRLMECAMESAHKAYAPYSKFHVGAAVLLADGTMVQGSNQENIAYPSGLCAERTALFSASAQHPEQAVVALAVVGHFEGEYTEASPCGAPVSSRWARTLSARYSAMPTKCRMKDGPCRR